MRFPLPAFSACAAATAGILTATSTVWAVEGQDSPEDPTEAEDAAPAPMAGEGEADPEDLEQPPAPAPGADVEEIDVPPPPDWDERPAGPVDFVPRHYDLDAAERRPEPVRQSQPTAPPREATEHEEAAEEAELDARLKFLTDRISTQRTHAEVWWTGFTGFFSAGLVVQATRAGYAEEEVDRTNFIISAIKAGGGVIRKGLNPYGEIVGTESFDQLPAQTLDDKRFKVAQAEKVLAHNAEETDPGGVWYAHVINLALNGVHAVIIGAAYDDWRTGLTSAAIGAGVGEVSILTQPWEADGDLEEYSERYGVEPVAPGESPPDLDVTVSVVPSAGGAGMVVSF